MRVELRHCGLQGWAFCDGNCGNCGTTATTTTDGFWYHGNGKIGGEFHPTKPDDEERYGEYVKVVRCRDCKHNGTWFCPVNMQADEIMAMDDNDYCSWGKRKDEVRNEAE